MRRSCAPAVAISLSKNCRPVCSARPRAATASANSAPTSSLRMVPLSSLTLQLDPDHRRPKYPSMKRTMTTAPTSQMMLFMRCSSAPPAQRRNGGGESIVSDIQAAFKSSRDLAEMVERVGSRDRNVDRISAAFSVSPLAQIVRSSCGRSTAGSAGGRVPHCLPTEQSLDRHDTLMITR